ncbi:hypothetical protein AYO45_04105 [Gammaproteobacteria bacterium SCGC AG-212-F23]|nr:hypothetical protein AYO45_04105 [Gammaproteobacteria bacterium SCGC AG-212-F23]
MYFTILVPKETRANELRVALIPEDAKQLITQGHKVFVEHNAGVGAGFSDQDYQQVGAEIRTVDSNDIASYKKFFKDINLIVRAKRPEHTRETLENKTITAGTIIVGALDPLEKNSSHINEYHQAKITAYSIDQLQLPASDPMNLLAAMSKISGKLALLDAMQKFHSSQNFPPLKKGDKTKAVLIGFGIVGRAALAEALNQQLPTTVILTNEEDAKEIKSKGATPVLLNKNDTLEQQQKLVKSIVADANIVITSARRPNQIAPLLIPITTLQVMQKGSVVVDMALSEGGNVEGSEHDVTHVLGNEVLVTNTSGYPKAMPVESSKSWSRASLHFILQLAANKNNIPLLPL